MKLQGGCFKSRWLFCSDDYFIWEISFRSKLYIVNLRWMYLGWLVSGRFAKKMKTKEILPFHWLYFTINICKFRLSLLDHLIDGGMISLVIFDLFYEFIVMPHKRICCFLKLSKACFHVRVENYEEHPDLNGKG